MKFMHDGEEFDIRFRYDPAFYAPYKRVNTFNTVCIISRVLPTIARGREKYVRYGEGTAMMDSRDVFVKDTGRKIALTRALLFQNRDFRKAAWQAYFNR